MPAELPSARGQMYDYFWDGVQSKWVHWADKVPPYVHQSEKKFNQILVPTIDTVRTEWLLSLQVEYI